jgi:mono/diheme cytochrome c family protein
MQSYRVLVLCLTFLGFAITRFALAADDGEKTFKEVCSQCHSAKVRPLDSKHLTKEQWNQAVIKMVDLGAEVPKEKIPALLDYLASTLGPAGVDPDKK